MSSRRPAGTPSPWSISALPTTTRMPLSTATSPIASVWWTVPMSNSVVVPFLIASVRPRRADADERGVIVRRLERPDLAAQPVEQVGFLGEAAEEGLAQVRVRLHEAGHEQRAGGVDHASRRRERRLGERTADSGDDSVAHEQVAAHDRARAGPS